MSVGAVSVCGHVSGSGEGAAERVIAAIERSVYGRGERLDQIVDAGMTTAKRGQAFAMVLAVTLVAAGLVFLVLGNNVAGAICISTPTVLLVQTFWPRRSRDDNSSDGEPGAWSPAAPVRLRASGR